MKNKTLYARAMARLLCAKGLTKFQIDVIMSLLDIKPGETWTYSQMARYVGRPNAQRAVGNALHANPFPILIPCHRVVASGGIGGFGLGIPTKRLLLGIEAAIAH